MLQTLLQNIFRFIILVLVQVLVLNNIQFLGFINPYIYILFILSLPIRTNRYLVVALGFVLGIIIDIFSNTLGLHAFATVLIAFLRNPLMNLITSFEENADFEPSLKTFGLTAYLKYVIVLVLLHHFTLFYLEIFSFSLFWTTFYRALLSSLVTILLILGIQLLKKR